MSGIADIARGAFAIARQELAGVFRSPVAAVFVGVFLIVVNLIFFTLSGFFARGLADVRPLFEWLPLLLLVLVSALTMKSWAEETRMGTLELLQTLPLHPASLVLGKFLSNYALVIVALVLTLPLPIMVTSLGPLDWGPVIGGYAASALIGATYVALGLLLSSTTDNQVVALLLTLVWGAFLYLLGHEAMVALVSPQTGELLRAVGTASRFESVERGVIDLRDLAYYAGIIVTLLWTNGALLALRRMDRTAAPRRALLHIAGATLVGLNALLLVGWLGAIPGLRLDLTSDGLYSISPVTRQTLADLDEPLYIDAYLSSRTHPFIAPLVPQVKDALAELEAVSGGRFTLTVRDPAEDEELASYIGETYGIESAPFGVSDRSQQSVVNAWFHILIRYGDEYRVLGLSDLIEYDADVSGADVDVRLRDLEYLLTSSIRKLSQDFQSLDNLLAALPADSKLVLYTTPDTLPGPFVDSVEHLRKLGAALADRSGGVFTFEEITPTPDQGSAIRERHGVEPLAADLFGQEVFYAHLVVQTGERVERIMPGPKASEAEVSRSLLAAVRRASPGQLKKIGLVTAATKPPPQDPRVPASAQEQPRPQDFNALTRALQRPFDIKTLDLSDGDVPDELDALILAKTAELDPESQWAVDQFLMRGGAVIALAGGSRIEARQGQLQAQPTDPRLLELISAWGVDIGSAFVLDPSSAPFPMPVREKRGEYVLERIELRTYPLFPDIRGGGLSEGHASLAGLTSLTTPWASPLSLREGLPADVKAEVVLRTSDQSWAQADLDIQPSAGGFAPPTDAPRSRQTVAITLSGPMTSFFADKASPVYGAPETLPDGADPTGRTLRTASSGARLAVVGSSELASDLLVQLASGPTGERHRNNLQLVQNLIDWSLEDTDLLSIRSASAFARTLPILEPSTQQTCEIAAYAGGLLPLGFIALIPMFWRRRLPGRLADLDRVEDTP